ncbi:MAG: PBP1A family penicillin-binding protein [Candidatus Shapirobacteria bacterium]|jgi:1A family penicillin-binding protein
MGRKKRVEGIKRFLILAGRPLVRTVKRISWGYFMGTILMVAMTVGMVWLYKQFLVDLPNINEIYNPPRLSTRILDRRGKLLYKFYDEENRSWTSIDRIPESLINATIAIEDKEFYQHHGISIKGIIQAVLYNFRKNGQQGPRGGSTITQQLVKNVYFTREKTWQRKIKEAILAVVLETKLTKKEILERYFNQVAYGGETYGAQEAAIKYFGKNVWEITAAESTFLAGLPAAPSSYSPFGSSPEYAHIRQLQVIDQMVNAGYIDERRALQLKNEKIVIAEENRIIRAPHFVFYVKDILEKKYGFVNFGRLGLTVTTSLDSDIQTMAEEKVKSETEKVKRLRISNGAAVVIDVKTGEILAMVGSKDYYSKEIDGKYNVTTALRQPGSSIKPINYLLALKNGMTLMSTIEDSPITYYVKGQKPYSPNNYNGKYMGQVTLRTALANSLNVPSVKLLEKNGVNNMIDLAESMGITTWTDRSRFGLALALGGAEVRMTELAQAYSVFANMGKKIDLSPVLRINNYLGETIFEKRQESDEIFEPRYAFLINNVLSDNQARTTIFGPNSLLRIEGKNVAVKTGTTNNLKDNWCIGWTPSYLVAAWVGNNDSSPMSWVASGISGATPIWNQIMKEMLAQKTDESWEVPYDVIKVNVCGREEYFSVGTEKDVKCSLHITPTPAQK